MKGLPMPEGEEGSHRPCSGHSAHEKIRTILRDHVGYVLVTCRSTKQPGKMEVEVSYEGDPDLASYLVDGAQGYFELEQEGDV